MSTSPPHPILDLCEFISRIPEPDRFDAIFIGCTALGKSPDPTGLKATRDRTLAELHWDLTIDDLRARLVELAQKVGLDEQFLVEGTLSVLESHIAHRSSEEFTERARELNLNAIKFMESELTRHAEDRRQQMTDAELNDLILKTKEHVTRLDQDRRDAELLLRFFQQERRSLFDLSYWDSFRRSQLRRLPGDLFEE